MDSNYALVDASGIVQNVTLWDGVLYDPETGAGWSPDPGFTAIQVTDATGNACIGRSYDATTGVFEQPPVVAIPPPTQAEIQAANVTKRSNLQAQATYAMAPVLMSLQLGDATDAETTLAKAWQTYYRALQAVDLTVTSPAWPTAPSS